MGRWAVAGVFGTVLALAGSVATPAPAEAATLSGHLKNAKTGRCLDSNFAGEVYTLPCQHGNDHQIWEISDDLPSEYRTAEDGHGRFRFRNRATGRCLWVVAAAGGSNGALGTASCVDMIPQYTTFIDGVGNGFSNVYLRGQHALTGGRPFCVGGSYSQAYAQSCNYSNPYQRWSRVRV
ncbi:RICIN domain-containing protein [Streptomyces sp. NPDC090741]|uniref:RICIN domain-containing protein n=1 Tax=Streptomyces sp. NPDC090741 TaxID=3365967 RepID=UPI0038054826